ncbi:hypothetical protein EGW08_021367 [Elysia chlorotica]|uniref:S1 motif domain-containing protein n=1 Tax=Elysia chlorotica TaxID=188477 RepID=A0A433SNN7_ELYCH|nr:hypothetical protein EGW08_021367 [Elysia chlorotica]
MDVKLVGAAVQFHGEELLHSLTDEQGEQPSSNVTSFLQRWRPSEPEIKDKIFQRNLCGFIARKSDLLFRPLMEDERNCNRSLEAIDDSFAIMPPLETFMNIPAFSRREEFWKSLRVNDCVTGVVTAIIDQGLRLTLLCIDKGVCRDIDDLNIPAFCPVKELPRLYAKESALDAFQKRDIVRGMVLSIVEETERIIVSLKTESVPDEKTYPRLGLITEDDFPVHYRRQSQIQDMSYEEMLQSILGFNNMGNVQSLIQQLRIPTTASYYRFFSRLKIPQKEYAEGLKKWQSQKLAHHSVVQGVEMFKKGDYLEAMQHLNRALQVDAENVEALVARGALYANKENFSSAIKDFEEALSHNPKHTNARNYLIETLLTVGRMCEERRDLEQAVTHYEGVLKIEEHHTEAADLLRGCRQLMVFQTNPDETKEKDEREKRKKSEALEGEDNERAPSSSLLKTSTDKLKALIKEDKQRKPRSTKKEKRRLGRSSSSERDTKKGKGRKRKRRRTARSSSSSQGSSSDTGSSYRSSSSGSSRGGRGHRRRSKKKGKDKKRSKKSKRSRKDSLKQNEKSRHESSAENDVSASSSKPNIARLETAGERERKGREDNGDAQSKYQGVPQYGADFAAEQLERDGLFYHKSAAMSFLPISSHDFFSTSSAIPGLGSPPPGASASISHQEGPKRLSKLRDSPSQGKDSSAHTLRMAKGVDRIEGYSQLLQQIPLGQKFLSMANSSPTDAGRKYRNHQEHSWTPSNEAEEAQHHIMGSGPGSRDHQGGAGKDMEVAGELGVRSRTSADRLGNERTSPSKGPHIIRRDDALIAQREEFYKKNKGGDMSFKKFRDSRSRSRSVSSKSSTSSVNRGKKASPQRRGKRSWTRSRSKSPGNRRQGKSKPTVTGIPELDHYLGGAKTLIQRAMEQKDFSLWKQLPADRSRSPSSPYKFASGSRSPRKYEAKSPNPNRNKSMSPSSKKYRLKSPSPQRLSSRSPHSRRITSQSPGPRQLEEYDREDKILASKESIRQSKSPQRSSREKERYEEGRNKKTNVSDQKTSSFGKFGPPPKNVTVRETWDAKEVSDVRQNAFQKPASDGYNKPDREDIFHSQREKPGSKSDPFSFMPRILRKPKMDDPDVNKPLLSSNQLERDRKLQKKSGGNDKETREGKEIMQDEAAGSNLRRQTRDMNNDGDSKGCLDDSKSKVNSWDQHRKTLKKRSDVIADQDTKRVDIVSLSSLQQGVTDDVKKSLEEEMEREIERRVRERLQHQGSSERVERQRHKEKDVCRSHDKKRSEENDSDSEDIRYSRKRSDISGENEDNRDHGKRKRSETGRVRNEIKEEKKGWCQDIFGNAYFAEYGKMLNVGKNYDVHGNVFYGQRDSFKPRSAGVWRSRNNNLGSRSRSRDRLRSRSRSSSSGSAGGSSLSKQKRSRSNEKPQGRGADAKDRAEWKVQGKEKTQMVSSELKDTESLTQPGVSSTNEPAETLAEKSGTKGPNSAESSELDVFTKSRWDAENKSRWDDGLDRGKQGGKTQRGEGDSLTELEKFLMELKQQKKKQWIAEGKVKGE